MRAVLATLFKTRRWLFTHQISCFVFAIADVADANVLQQGEDEDGKGEENGDAFDNDVEEEVGHIDP